eukprot:12572107-Ditylum_brightwellii.AAC.1
MKISCTTLTAVLCVVLSVDNVASFAFQGASSARRNNVRLNMSAESDKTRVVVTGLGVISGCGIGHSDFFQSCLDGKSSLGTVTRFDASKYPCSIGSEVPDEMFDPNDHFTNPKN